MPRRITSADDSDDDTNRSQAKKRRPPAKKAATTKPAARTRNTTKTKAVQKDPLITTWTQRRTVESLDGIEDIDDVAPKKETRKPTFKGEDCTLVLFCCVADEDVDRVPAVAQLAVHKRKVAEVSKWLKEFPHHRKVTNGELCIVLRGETACAVWAGGGG
jgi:hypothetical protein